MEEVTSASSASWDLARPQMLQIEAKLSLSVKPAWLQLQTQTICALLSAMETSADSTVEVLTESENFVK